MKRHVWPLPMAAVLLCGCMGSAASEVPAATAAPEPSAQAEAATPETAPDPTATPEPIVYADTAPAGVELAGDAVLPYDEIRLASGIKRAPGYFAEGYYTVSQDDQWGVILSDGAGLLPCADSAPVNLCILDGLLWHYSGEELSEAEYSALTEQTEALSNTSLCQGAHDGWLYYWFYDTDSQTASLDGGMMLGNSGAIPQADHDDYGAYLPCLRGHFAAAGTDNNDLDCYVYDTPLCYVYADADSALLNDQTYEDAVCFYDQPLAAAKSNGKWLYLDTDGNAVTDAVYDGVYGAGEEANKASPLLNGYAAVCRDGKWGLLDSAGQEFIPCEYAGTAWDGYTLWLKLDDGWHPYHIPGVEKQAAFTLALPENITAPQYECRPSECIKRITTDEGNLNLRAGPGTDYEKVGSIPPSTEILSCGFNYWDDSWVLTQYDGQYGWVSAEYLGWPQ